MVQPAARRMFLEEKFTAQTFPVPPLFNACSVSVQQQYREGKHGADCTYIQQTSVPTLKKRKIYPRFNVLINATSLKVLTNLFNLFNLNFCKCVFVLD